MIDEYDERKCQIVNRAIILIGLIGKSIYHYSFTYQINVILHFLGAKLIIIYYILYLTYVVVILFNDN